MTTYTYDPPSLADQSALLETTTQGAPFETDDRDSHLTFEALDSYWELIDPDSDFDLDLDPSLGEYHFRSRFARTSAPTQGSDPVRDGEEDQDELPTELSAANGVRGLNFDSKAPDSDATAVNSARSVDMGGVLEKPSNAPFFSLAPEAPAAQQPEVQTQTPGIDAEIADQELEIAHQENIEIETARPEKNIFTPPTDLTTEIVDVACSEDEIDLNTITNKTGTPDESGEAVVSCGLNQQEQTPSLVSIGSAVDDTIGNTANADVVDNDAGAGTKVDGDLDAVGGSDGDVGGDADVGDDANADADGDVGGDADVDVGDDANVDDGDVDADCDSASVNADTDLNDNVPDPSDDSNSLPADIGDSDPVFNCETVGLPNAAALADANVPATATLRPSNHHRHHHRGAQVPYQKHSSEKKAGQQQSQQYLQPSFFSRRSIFFLGLTIALALVLLFLAGEAFPQPKGETGSRSALEAARATIARFTAQVPAAWGSLRSKAKAQVSKIPEQWRSVQTKATIFASGFRTSASAKVTQAWSGVPAYWTAAQAKATGLASGFREAVPQLAAARSKVENVVAGLGKTLPSFWAKFHSKATSLIGS